MVRDTCLAPDLFVCGPRGRAVLDLRQSGYAPHGYGTPKESELLPTLPPELLAQLVPWLAAVQERVTDNGQDALRLARCIQLTTDPAAILQVRRGATDQNVQHAADDVVRQLRPAYYWSATAQAAHHRVREAATALATTAARQVYWDTAEEGVGQGGGRAMEPYSARTLLLQHDASVTPHRKQIAHRHFRGSPVPISTMDACAGIAEDWQTAETRATNWAAAGGLYVWIYVYYNTAECSHDWMLYWVQGRNRELPMCPVLTGASQIITPKALRSTRAQPVTWVRDEADF